MSNREIVLVGFSGHGFVVADAAIASNLNLNYYSDKRPVSNNPFNLAYLGFEGDCDFSFWNNDYDFILGIGDNQIRRKTAELIRSKGRDIINVIHPTASLSAKVILGTGNFISRNVAVNVLAEIGNNCILNTGSIIEHECVIGNNVHIAPGAVLAGNVTIGNNSFIGANAVIKQGVTIGSDVIIGAGSVVIKNISNSIIVVGNPAKVIS